MRSGHRQRQLFDRALIILLLLVVAGCSSTGTAPGSGLIPASPMASPSESLPPGIAGEACSEQAEVRGELSCVRGRDGLRWQPRYTYRDQACDPESPTLKANKVILPERNQPESRIAAACVALEWFSNESVDSPELAVISKRKLSVSVLTSLRADAKAALRLFWKYRGVDQMDPALIVITSPAEHCEITREYQVAGEADRVAQSNDCTDTRQFSCESLQVSGFAVMWDAKNSIDKRLAGYKTSGCGDEAYLGLSFHKFWQGVGASLTTDSATATNFSTALVNPDYLISEYPSILWDAAKSRGSANLCGPGAEYYVCQDWFRGNLTEFVSSSLWWQGQEPEHELSIWSQQYNYARQAAMEWFIAHFGLDAAYGLPQALVGVTDEEGYLAVLDSYTDLTHTQLFAQIDAWAASKFGIVAP